MVSTDWLRNALSAHIGQLADDQQHDTTDQSSGSQKVRILVFGLLWRLGVVNRTADEGDMTVTSD